MSKTHQRFYDSYVQSGQAGAAPTYGHTDLERRFSAVNPYFIQRILPHLPSTKKARILDLACGHGKYLYLLRQQGYTNIAGVDISPEQIALANQLAIDGAELGDLASFVQAQTQAIDAVLLIDIIEHLTLEETHDLLTLLRDRSELGSKVIIHVPNAEGLFGMRIRYGDLTHITAFTPTSIRQLAKSIGYTSIKCFEDKPVVHGFKSFMRSLVWMAGTAPFRLLLLAETGRRGAIFSQNMLVVLQ